MQPCLVVQLVGHNLLWEFFSDLVVCRCLSRRYGPAPALVSPAQPPSLRSDGAEEASQLLLVHVRGSAAAGWEDLATIWLPQDI